MVIEKLVKRRCSWTKPDGSQCRAYATIESEYCFFHNPDVKEKRHEARRRGGLVRLKHLAVLPPDAADLPVETYDDAVRLLSKVANLTLKGKLDSRIASSVGSLIAIQLRAIEQKENEKQAKQKYPSPPETGKVKDELERELEKLSPEAVRRIWDIVKKEENWKSSPRKEHHSNERPDLHTEKPVETAH